MKYEPFEELKASVDLMKQIMRGERDPGRAFESNDPEDPAAARLRARRASSRSQFARLLGISVRTLQCWEQ